MTTTTTARIPAIWTRIALTALSLGVVAAAVLTASSAAAYNSVSVVINKHTHMCADVVGGSIHDGARVHQYDCYGGLPTRWQFTLKVTPSGNYHEIRNQNSNRCLDVPYGDMTPGVQLQQFSCWDGAMQQWVLEYVGDGYYLIKPRSATWLCLDDKDWNTSLGAAIQLWRCDANSAAQLWRLYGV